MCKIFQPYDTILCLKEANNIFRHSERFCRPTFPQLVELLSRADFELFLWEEEDLRNSDPRVREIGAPLEITTGLYTELQETYIGKK